MRREIGRGHWQTYLKEFTERNKWRVAQLRISGRIGAPLVEGGLPFVSAGIRMEGEGAPLAEISLADGGSGTSRLTRRIPFVSTIAQQSGAGGSAEAMEILSDNDMRALLTFYSQPDTTAA